MKNHLLLLYLCCCPAFIVAQDMGGGIIYGSDYVFALKAPKGWVLDNKAGVAQGANAVFYPKGSSWEHGVSVMYTNFIHFGSAFNANIDSMINYDARQYTGPLHDIVIKHLDDMQIDSGRSTARVYYFLKDSYGNYESVAYIAEENGVVFIVLSSRKEKEFYNYLPAFEELVGSYFWMGTDVQIK